MAVMQFNLDEWKKIVGRVLNVWSGYQIAIDIEAGGPETKLKHEWFSDVLSEHIHDTRSLNADNLEEWIQNILYADFDLVLEDDSIFPTAHLLIEAYSYFKNNNRLRLDQVLASLPSEEVVKNAKKLSRRNDDADNGSISGDSDMELSEYDDGDDKDDGAPKRERVPRTVTDDDGWTTIVSRK